jgi:hypothetical protein
MSEFLILFPSLLDLMDFMATTGNMGSKRVRERCSSRGFFSEAELELAVNGMHGLVKPFGIKKGLYEESRRVKASSRLK